jgi:quercetin dioxygenase-like cupin family protein
MMKIVLVLALAAAPFVALADPDPAAMSLTREADIQWRENPAVPGLRSAVLYGSPPNPGPYVVRVRFPPGTFSAPHFHPEERQIVVLKGTWWVGAGPNWDRNATTPLPAGSFVVHRANQIHFDGAKDEEVIVQISGIGTNATTFVDESGKPK